MMITAVLVLETGCLQFNTLDVFIACCQARRGKFGLGGGLFWTVEKTINDLDPDFTQSLISLSRFFVLNKVISPPPKKSLHPNSVSFSDQL